MLHESLSSSKAPRLGPLLVVVEGPLERLVLEPVLVLLGDQGGEHLPLLGSPIFEYFRLSDAALDFLWSIP